MLINKILTTVAPPVGATVGLVRAGMAACQCGTIGGGIVMAGTLFEVQVTALKAVPVSTIHVFISSPALRNGVATP